ncbi:MAG TPA: hypothetical protein VGL93_15090, partial [Streptosporangiaceae bacterium]
SDHFHRDLLPTLVALYEGARSAERVALRINQPLARCVTLLAELSQLGLINDRLYLTDEGWAELTSKKTSPLERFMLNGSRAPYYPQALRRVDDI